jgi:hypothetical protein
MDRQIGIRLKLIQSRNSVQNGNMKKACIGSYKTRFQSLYQQLLLHLGLKPVRSSKALEQLGIMVA